ncbi:adenosylhomocysteinase [Archangium primigenium]|uniref:adenosylhomocysteinase n=1 Tax=[Archangium] primigenium TaxID=2792470 RepID=UPI00195B65CA|nr:adenosylhomocysteinase [Archangium primigenium]MBM7118911.1 adenosylhomocysteinase [Archangium primigenium]
MMDVFARELAWARLHMPLTRAGGEALPDLKGIRLACSMHLDLKMIPAVEALLDKGAAVFLTTCNATTVRDEVVAWLRARGAEAHAWKDMSPEALAEGTARALAWGPTHLCEMGADLSGALHAREGGPAVRGSLEATGSGIARLRALSPRYPVFNWDDLPIKEGLHNRWLVGLTTWLAFCERTHLSLHGKRVLVVGHGRVGQGVADVARAFGATVEVAERDAARLLEARYAGWDAGPLTPERLARAEVIVTATGAARVIGAPELAHLRAGCFLLNVGHVADELDVAALGPRRELLPHVEEVSPRGRPLYLFAGGSMANLTAGWGDSLNAFDVTLATLLAGLGFLFTEGERQAPGLHPLPRAVWASVAVAAAAR